MQIAKWGNSLAVRLPKALVSSMGLAIGDDVCVRAAKDGALELERADRKTKALERLSQVVIGLPQGYRFDRDEANER